MDHTPYQLTKRTHTKKPMVKMSTRQKALASARHRVLARQRNKMEMVQRSKEEAAKEDGDEDGEKEKSSVERGGKQA